ncbi:unnamed protein product [Caenorhabditis bovis]|uniref:Uncharacterized protein n=1 Tax=Caenorhabditis bovis TaxID=2654633 RepID=A0A8S1EAV9_9PELO|nr:unnamed protein product [Caenorhabditis bovis]
MMAYTSEYLCKVDICIRDFYDSTASDKFENMWRKIPHNVNWCSTNAQMSIIKFSTRHELTIYNVRNMLESRKSTLCNYVIVEFDGDESIKSLNLERYLENCNVQYLRFSYTESGGLANRLKNIKPIIDYLVVGPSNTSSYLLFQQFLNGYEHIMPVICQVNFAFSLPKFAEENGFRESLLKLKSDGKYVVIAASKDRTDMHLNLFFVNMRHSYCRDRYLRYFSYY